MPILPPADGLSGILPLRSAEVPTSSAPHSTKSAAFVFSATCRPTIEGGHDLSRVFSDKHSQPLKTWWNVLLSLATTTQVKLKYARVSKKLCSQITVDLS